MTEALKIREIAGQAGQQNNCRIYDIYKHRDRLQIFIDKERESVNLEDCENVFHSLRFLLESELPHILENRRLEVSSPGIEKQLREEWHFKEAIGKTIKLTTHVPVPAQNLKTGKSFFSQSFKAELLSLSEQTLNLKNDSLNYSVPLSQIKSAKMIFKTSTNSFLKKRLTKKKKSEVNNVS